MNNRFTTRSVRTLLAAAIGLGTLGITAQAQASPGLCAPQPTPTITRIANPPVFYEDGYTLITLKLSNPSCTTVSVVFHTIEGTAQAGEDYKPWAGTVVFKPGETASYIQLSGVDDDVQEGVKWFKTSMIYPVGATVPIPVGYLYVNGVEPQ